MPEYLIVFSPRGKGINFNPSPEEFDMDKNTNHKGFFPMPALDEVMLLSGIERFSGWSKTDIKVDEIDLWLNDGLVYYSTRRNPLTKEEINRINSDLAKSRLDMEIQFYSTTDDFVYSYYQRGIIPSFTEIV
ncbi:MAG: hypothetical protein AABY03_02065 [Nanoarchaeota archaeon]